MRIAQPDDILIEIDDLTSIIEVSDISPIVMDVTADVIERDVSPLFLVIYESGIYASEYYEIKKPSWDVFPNLFNSATTIKFSLPKQDRVTIKIFNIVGREMGTLLDGIYSQGNHSIIWDGIGLCSGVYFCKLIVGDEFTQTRKLVLFNKL